MKPSKDLVNMTGAILEGKYCPYCQANTECRDSAFLYNGKSYGNVWYCPSCGAYVGCHKGTQTALGRVADAPLREAKKKAHQYFDRIAKGKSLINAIWPEYIPGVSNRGKSYLWLAKKMNIQVEYCHIGMMDIEQCEQVVAICRSALEPIDKQRQADISGDQSAADDYLDYLESQW